MKRILLAAILALCASGVHAAPFVVADLADQTTTHCTLSLDGGAFGPDVPVVGTPKQCKHDLTAVTVGAHSARLVAVKVDSVWGRLESAPSSPLAFSRPATPAAPSGPTLTP